MFTPSQALGLAMELHVSRRIRKIRLSLAGRSNLQSDVGIFLQVYIECVANIRVLIVDDTERVREDLRTFLTLIGDIVLIGEASNGLHAVRLTETLRPQVVLMDLEMPIMDGYEATQQIKALQPSCRVIALTIHADETERQRAFGAGADGFIVKSTPLETLMDAIHNAPVAGHIPKGEKS